MLPSMRAWLIDTVVVVVVVAGLGTLSGCSKNNPGWTASASGGSEATLSTGMTTVDETSTITTTDTTSDTATGSTTGEPIQCPLDGAYCPFYTDVAEAPDQGTCDGTETYVAQRNGTSFFRCGDANACAADDCTELVIQMPDVYGIIVNPLAECIVVEHEQKWINGKCRTRALAAWASDDDADNDAPQIVLASHDPSPPPSLTDLTITDTGERLECECKTVGCVDFIVDKDSWCCGGNLSLGSYAITNDTDMTYRANYTQYLGNTPIEYRGCTYNFFVTQGHDGSPMCAGEPKFQAGWFMQRLGCSG